MYTSEDESMVNNAIGIGQRILVTKYNNSDNHLKFSHSKCWREYRKARSSRNGIAIDGDAIKQ